MFYLLRLWDGSLVGWFYNTFPFRHSYKNDVRIRRMAENGFAPPPLGNFADISYLVEN